MIKTYASHDSLQAPDKSVHLILIDPPYGITSEEWDSPWVLGYWEQLITQIDRILAHHGHFICFCANEFTIKLTPQIQEAFKRLYKLFGKKSQRKNIKNWF